MATRLLASGDFSAGDGSYARRARDCTMRASARACSSPLEEATREARSSSVMRDAFESWPPLARADACRAHADSTARFCLQPPGDTIPRAGIVDALSVGCIPVFFHPQQQRLWPRHWNASQASLLFDWSTIRGNASQVLHTLLAMPAERVGALHRAAADAARNMYYRGEVGERRSRDAVDVLVDVLVREL